MRLSKDISERLFEIAEPVVTGMGFELVDIEFRQEDRRNILDITIDKEDGVLVDDCALISGKLSLLFDVEDLIQQQYYLEVGSPGLFRELKKASDFQRSIGKRVKAVFSAPVKGQKQFVGYLNGIENQVIKLGNSRQDLEVSMSGIKKIQLFPEI